jgi:hypothetical protein
MDVKTNGALCGVKRGDNVVVVFYGYRKTDQPKVSHEEVVSAGHKYVSTANYKFHRESGNEVTGYTVMRRAFASELDWLNEQRDKNVRSALAKALKDIRVWDLPLAEAERVLAALTTESAQ